MPSRGGADEARRSKTVRRLLQLAVTGATLATASMHAALSWELTPTLVMTISAAFGAFVGALIEYVLTRQGTAAFNRRAAAAGGGDGDSNSDDRNNNN
jgi:hypothetical protein